MNECSYLDPLSDEEILTLTILGEARGEAIEGQVAVGSVIRNRLHTKFDLYKNFRNVCLEPMQFSCWNPNDPNKGFLADLAKQMMDGQTFNDPVIKQCMLVAHGIIQFAVLDNTRGATHYMTMKLFYSTSRPLWAAKTTAPAHIGNQVFFNLASEK